MQEQQTRTEDRRQTGADTGSPNREVGQAACGDASRSSASAGGGIAHKTPRAKARATRRAKRDGLTYALIKVFVSRDTLKNGKPEWVSQATWEREMSRVHKELAERQFEFERLMIQRLGLDHLEGVDRVYGLKRRELKLQKLLKGALAA